MAIEVGTAYVTVLPSARKFAPQLRREVEGASESSGKAAGSRFGRVFMAASLPPLRAFGAAALGLFAVDKIGEFLKTTIGGASDLNETVNKSNVIFKENAREIERWANGAAKNLGLSKGEALDAAAGFGNMFSQLGFARGTAADMSKQVVQLAADLGSFNNLSTADVTERMSAAFRGEYDSLQALIPNINAARVEQEALSRTGKKSADDLTAQEKAAATLAIVMKDGAAAQGDFGRTSDGLANRQKILAAQFADVKARIGAGLLPVLQELAGFASTTLLPGLEKVGGFVIRNLGPALTVGQQAFTALVDGIRGADIPKDGPLAVAGRIGAGIRDGFNAAREAATVFFDALRGRSELNEFDGLQKVLNNVGVILHDVGAAALPVLQQLVGRVVELAQQHGPKLAAVLDAVGTALGRVAIFVEQNHKWLVPLVGAILAGVAAWRTYILVTKGIALVQLAITGLRGAVIALNVAMRANPIGIIITLIAALVAGIVIAYKRSETFRNIVQAVWSGIKTAVSAVVNWFTGTAWPAIQSVWDGIATGARAVASFFVAGWNGIRAAFDAVGAAANWLWTQVIQPVFNFIATAAKLLVAILGTVLFTPMTIAFNALRGPVMWLWQNAIVPAFNGIRAVVSTVVGWLVSFVRANIELVRQIWSTVWTGIRVVVTTVWNTIRGVVTTAWNWIWRTLLQPGLNTLRTVWQLIWTTVSRVLTTVWNGIRTTVTTVWNAIWGGFLKPALDRLVLGWTRIWDGIRTTVQTVWDGIKATISTVWERGIRPIFDAVKSAVKLVGDAFGLARDAIGLAWDKVAGIARKPIEFVINTVYRDGIKKTFDSIAESVGLDLRLPAAPKLPAYASGGPVRGPGGPRSDSVLMWGSAGEYMQPYDAVRYYGHRFMDAVRRRLIPREALPGYAKGGVVQPVAGRVTQGWSEEHGGIDWAAPTGTTIRAAMAGIVNLVRHMRTSYGNHAKINHGGGVETLYAHMSRVAVDVGRRLVAGSKVGNVGSTGNSTGPHLHFEVRQDGRRINPARFLAGAMKVGDQGGFGGFITDAWKKFSSVGGWVKDKAQAAWDFVSKPGEILRKFVGGAVDKLLDKVPGGGMLRDLARALPQRAVDWLVQAGKGLADKIRPPEMRGGTSGAAQEIALGMLGQFGWGGGQWSALRALWQGESGWRWNAENPSSGAYGIPQSLPASKMASAGRDWRTNPATQIRWGLGYIRDRYGSPEAAYAAWLRRSPHWYDTGGLWKPGTLGYNGSGQTEAVFSGPQWRRLEPALAAMADGRGGGQPLIGQFIVQPAPGMDERMLAAESARKLAFVVGTTA